MYAYALMYRACFRKTGRSAVFREEHMRPRQQSMLGVWGTRESLKSQFSVRPYVRTYVCTFQLEVSRSVGNSKLYTTTWHSKVEAS